jgi:hypothetical protein
VTDYTGRHARLRLDAPVYIRDLAAGCVLVCTGPGEEPNSLKFDFPDATNRYLYYDEFEWVTKCPRRLSRA